MATEPLVMRFDPQTVKHLGVKMYSQLPSALAEIISNSYDAYAKKVTVILTENEGVPMSIEVRDNGIGLSRAEINEKFLVIGRNRRNSVSEDFKPPFQREPTGKKGLGKLALFGLAKVVTIRTIQDGFLNEFVLDYNKLISAIDAYNPEATIVNEKTEEDPGTSVTLTELKRKASFDHEGLIDSLSRIFLLDETFKLFIQSPSGETTEVTNEHKYKTIEKEFSWNLEEGDLIEGAPDEYKGICGSLFTSLKPITPSSGLRGITLYSRGKLVNLPEYFSESTSSHFYSYLTGWISIDFIDDLEEDVISTNRQSIAWDDPGMPELLKFLRGVVSKVNVDWRKKRKEKKLKKSRKRLG